MATITTLVASVVIGVLSAWATTLVTAQTAKKRRQHEAIVQISVFRHQRIHTLRKTLSKFQSRMFIICSGQLAGKGAQHSEVASRLEETYRLGTKIELLVDHSDPAYSQLRAVMEELAEIASGRGSSGNLPELDKKFVAVSREIVDRAQERLDADLSGSR